MELSAILNGSDLCIGSTFVIANERIRVADIIVFGRLVTGFVTVARDDQIVVDIKTALLACWIVSLRSRATRSNEHGASTTSRRAANETVLLYFSPNNNYGKFAFVFHSLGANDRYMCGSCSSPLPSPMPWRISSKPKR
jgi:hypothetical protein